MVVAHSLARSLAPSCQANNNNTRVLVLPCSLNIQGLEFRADGDAGASEPCLDGCCWGRVCLSVLDSDCRRMMMKKKFSSHITELDWEESRARSLVYMRSGMRTRKWGVYMTKNLVLSHFAKVSRTSCRPSSAASVSAVPLK